MANITGRKFVNGEYTDMTSEEKTEYLEAVKLSNEEEIISLKLQLSDTDYKAIKYAEGWISEEEYAPIKAERQKIRDKINELENNCLSDGTEVTE